MDGWMDGSMELFPQKQLCDDKSNCIFLRDFVETNITRLREGVDRKSKNQNQ